MTRDQWVGLLPLDKPEGPTSHDIVRRVRRIVGVRRVGHAGTLDPFASGLLLVCVGWATRLQEYLSALPKRYQATVRLGARTDTDDGTGTVISRSDDWRTLTPGRIRQALQEQVGEFRQMPPAYSAKRVGGQRAYAIARSGDQPRLAPQAVTVYEAELQQVRLPDIELELECSGGTYVRSIARDLGHQLDVGAHLVSLRRSAIGRFTVGDAFRIDDSTTRDQLVSRSRPPRDAVGHLPSVHVTAEQATVLRHGQSIASDTKDPAQPIAILCEERLIGIGAWEDGHLHPRKIFPQA